MSAQFIVEFPEECRFTLDTRILGPRCMLPESASISTPRNLTATIGIHYPYDFYRLLKAQARLAASTHKVSIILIIHANNSHFAKIGRRRRERHGKQGWGKGRRGTMGQEESSLVDSSADPITLDRRDISSVAKYIKDGKAQNIVVMVRKSCPTGGSG